MPIATTLPPGLGGTLALLLLLVIEIAMITVMVVATMGGLTV